MGKVKEARSEKKKAKQEKLEARNKYDQQTFAQIMDIEKTVATLQGQMEKLSTRLQLLSRDSRYTTLALSYLGEYKEVEVDKDGRENLGRVDDLPSAPVKFYKQVGRSFMCKPRAEVAVDLEKQNVELQKEIPKLQVIYQQFAVRQQEAIRNIRDVAEQAKVGRLHLPKAGIKEP